MILLVDNYDSFTYNLVHLIQGEYEDIKVIKNDEMTIDEIKSLNPKAIVISPGPGNPADAGICIELIKSFYKTTPILGVCLGHQAIGLAFGGRIVKADNLVHGRTDEILHKSSRILENLPNENTVVRYHSLVVDKATMPDCLKISSISKTDNLVMSIEHEKYHVYGLQFHPESYSTKHGDVIIKNFIKSIGGCK